MDKRIYTKGNIEVQNIKIGDVHYEFEYGAMIKSTVQTLPVEKDGYWTWESVTDSGRKVEYGVREGMSHYAPNLYDYIAYSHYREIK